MRFGFGWPDLTRIFTLFTQVDTSHTRLQGGLGLGLTLVQEIVTAHGGRVEVRSKDAGFDAHITKPVDFAALLALLKKRLV